MSTYDVMIGGNHIVCANTKRAADVVVGVLRDVKEDLRGVEGLEIRSVESDRDRRDAHHEATPPVVATPPEDPGEAVGEAVGDESGGEEF